MIKTILFLIIFITGITLNTIWIIPVAVIRLFRIRKADRWLGGFITRSQAKVYLKILGVSAEIKGLENCKGLDGNPLCVISNHQGTADIPLVIAHIPFTCGFVAKKELAHLPMFFAQMWYLRCVLLNRKSPRSAVKAIDKAVVNIKNGYPMLIFPEGTRSRCSKMNDFKKGSLKLATRSKAIVLPITINGSYKALEEQGVPKPAHVRIVIHEPLETKEMDKEELKDLHSRLSSIIRSGLDV